MIENKFFKILLNLLKIENLEQFFEPTHESFIRLLCNPMGEILALTSRFCALEMGLDSG